MKLEMPSPLPWDATAAPSGAGLRAWMRSAAQRTPALWWLGLLMAALSFAALLGLWLDERQLLGVNVWVKPWKFMVSSALHLLTMALFATFLADTALNRRRMARLSAVAVLTSLFEVGYISWRASRGEASHFNIGTPFAGAMYSLMGIGALLLSGCTAVLARWLWQERALHTRQALRWGLVLGLGLSFVLGAAVGGVLGSGNGHWVGGTRSDAGGLPVFLWSRDGGDLRVAHFFGLHAMQFIPAVAWAAARWAPDATATRLTWAFAAAYTVLTVFTFVQALRGQPFLGGVA